MFQYFEEGDVDACQKLGGRLMMESGNPAKMNEMELDLKSLGCGVYILQTVKGTEVRTIRFIKS